MANINTYLAQIMEARYGKDVRQAIHDSIQQINNDVSVDNQDVVQKLGPYVDQKIITKQDKLVAGTGISIAADGKTISSTVQSDVTKAYVDQSDLVPVKENIATLDHQVETLEDASEGRLYTSTATSGSGTQTVPADSLCRAIVKQLDGKTVVQDGALVSADVSAVKSVGVNLIEQIEMRGLTEYTSNGITMTKIDGTNAVKVVGTSTGSVYSSAASNHRTKITLDAGTYKISGYEQGMSLYIFPFDGGSGLAHTTSNSAAQFTLSQQTDVIASIVILTGYTYNTVFHPMLYKGVDDKEYIDYHGDTHTIPSSVRTSYPLRSAGEVHDSISWDGSKWWHTKKVGVVDLSTINWNYASGGCFWYGSKPDMKINGSINTAMYQTISTDINSSTPSGVVSTKYSSNARIDVKNGSSDDKPTGSANYELATPIITDITALMNWDASIAVEAGGTVEFSNQQLLDVDNVVEYKVGKSVVTSGELNEAIVTLGNAKQDVISDLSTIRSGAAAGAAALPANPSNWPTMTSAQQDTACAVVGAERKLADGWVLKGTMTDTNGITVDLTGCTELAVFGVAVVTANTSIMSNIGRLSYNCLKTNAKAVLLIYEDSVWGFCCTHAKSANSTAPVTMADNSAGDSKVDGSKLADINSIYFSDPTNVISCNIKIYAR